MNYGSFYLRTLLVAMCFVMTLSCQKKKANAGNESFAGNADSVETVALSTPTPTGAEGEVKVSPIPQAAPASKVAQTSSSNQDLSIPAAVLASEAKPTPTPGFEDSKDSKMTVQNDQIINTAELNSLSIDENEIAKVANFGGFIYDEEQDIYYTKIDALQRHAGYNRLFDKIALPIGMAIDCEPIDFTYQNKRYMLELWKGQYYASSGAEIGFYEKSLVGWKAVGNDDLLQMRFTLMRNGTELYSRSDTTWWLTGFKPGEFSNASELVMQDINIRFKDTGMRDAFLTALFKLGYNVSSDQITVHGSNVGFRFTHPKSKQPWPATTQFATQVANKTLVKSYNLARTFIGRSDNSPQTIGLLIDKIPGIKYVPN